MYTLNPNWITEGRIDFEYKQYMLLAYLQSLDKYFLEKKLYPNFSQLIKHYNNLIQLHRQLLDLELHFPKTIKALDLQNKTINYQELFENDKTIADLKLIIQFALPKIESEIKKGALIFDEIESAIKLYSLGILPNYLNDGYFIISNLATRQVHLFHYEVGFYIDQDLKEKNLKTDLIRQYEIDQNFSYERIKISAIHNGFTYATTPTFIAETHAICPLEETLLPVTKQKLIKYISAIAA